MRYIVGYTSRTIMWYNVIAGGRLRVKLPTIWTDGKAEVGRVREEKRRDETRREERSEEKESEERRCRCAKGRKVVKHCVFSNDCGSGGSKSRLAKWRVRSQLARWEMKNCTPLWREAHFQVKMYKTHQRRTTSGSWDVEKSARPCGAKHVWKSKCTKHTRVGALFGSWDVEKVHAVVARSKFPSQHVQRTPCSDHFWKLTCRKSARHCGTKRISKSKCTKHVSLGTFLEVEMLKKCTPLWREAHFEVKMYKARQPRNTFGSWDVEKVYTVVARSAFRSQNVQSTTCWRHFWTLKRRFVWQAQGILHPAKSEQNVRVL